MRSIDIFLLFIPFAACTLNFTHLGYHKFANSMFQDNATKSAYHPTSRMLYIIGETTKTLHIVDLTNPMMMTVEYSYVFGVENPNDVNDGRLTDIAICGDIFAVSVTDIDVVDAGHIYFFRTYTKNDNSLTPLTPRREEVGPYPKRIAFVSDCTRLLVANEGRPAASASGGFFYTDPPGSITLIKNINPAGRQLRTLTRTQEFTQYDDANSLLNITRRGVRFIFREREGKFSQDAEPDSVVIDDRDEIAYIVLQENNAVVRYNLATELIMDIHPFGEKDWNNYDMDASDIDGAQLKRHNIHSFYQPGDMKFLRIQNQSYLLTANTGAIKRYTTEGENWEFNEAQRSGILYSQDPNLFDISDALKQKMQDNNELGSLYISKIDGKGVSNLIESIKTYGGRSITLWKADDVTMVYDSGQTMEEQAKGQYERVFNGECSVASDTPDAEADKRSDNFGVEPSAIDSGAFDSSTTVVVVGTRTSLLYLYTLTGTSLFFQRVYNPAAGSRSWSDLQAANFAGNAIITDVMYLDASESPDRLPMVIAISSGSSSIETLRVSDDGITRRK